MKGCRPLSKSEEKRVLFSFSGKYANRDKALYFIGTKTGFRISELLSLRVKDVWQYGKVVNEITVQKKNMKKKIESRTVPISHEVKRILKAWIQRLERMGLLQETRFLFCSQEQKQKAITRQRAWQILKDVFSRLELTGKLATHTLRKTCAARLYEYFKGDLAKLQKALGHKNINSTISYISFLESDVFNGFLAI